MAVFNDVNLTGSDHFVFKAVTEIGNGVGQSMNVPFGALLLIGIVFLTFAGSKVTSFPKAMASATFIASVLATIMVKIGWITNTILYFCVGFFVISLFLLWSDS